MDPLSKIPEIAKDFVENYYKLVDHARHKLKDIYCIGCKITWDGRPVPFTDPVNCPEFQKLYLEEIPISKHDVRSVDAQPMTLRKKKKNTFFSIHSLIKNKNKI